MCNIKGRKFQFFLQISDQGNDLSLNSDIQSCGRFITDQNLRVAGQCNSNDYALAHTTGILERIFIKSVGCIRNTDTVHDFNRLRLRFSF